MSAISKLDQALPGRIIDLLSQNGSTATDREIADEVGCRPQTVHYYRRQLDMPVPGRRHLSDEQRCAARDLERATDKAIARRTQYLADRRLGFVVPVEVHSAGAVAIISSRGSSLTSTVARDDRWRRLFTTDIAASNWLTTAPAHARA